MNFDGYWRRLQSIVVITFFTNKILQNYYYSDTTNHVSISHAVWTRVSNGYMITAYLPKTRTILWSNLS